MTIEQEVIKKVLAEAWANPEYKQELIANPVSAIEGLTGTRLEIPAGKTFQVFDKSDENVICLNIPPKPNMEDVELSEEQLEIVAGGSFPFPIIDWEKILGNSTIQYPPE